MSEVRSPSELSKLRFSILQFGPGVANLNAYSVL